MQMQYLLGLGCFLAALRIPQINTQSTVARGCNGEADVIFLVDTSRNVSQADFQNSINFVRRLVFRLDINFNLTRVGLAITEVGAYGKINLFEYGDKSLLINAIDQVTRTQGVAHNLPGALRFVRNSMFTLQQGARNSVPDIVYIIAHDSVMYHFDTNPNELTKELDTTKSSRIFVGMLLYGTDYTADYKRSRANRLVSPPADRNFLTISQSQSLTLDSIFTVSLTALCLEIPACAGLADIAFVLDRTGSVGFTNFRTMLGFVERVVENMYIAPDGVRISLIVYGVESQLLFPLDRYSNKMQILQAVDQIPYNEALQTRTDLALEMLRTQVFGTGNGNRINVRDIAVVVTDGSSSDEVKTEFEAKTVRDRGIRVFSIGVQNNFDEDFQQELDLIGSDPDFDHVFQVSTFSNLQQIEDTLVKRTCREAPPNCTKAVDMVFAIDASGSIDRVDFLRVVNFVRDLVSRLGVENGSARVGVVAFSSAPQVQFQLNQYTRVSDMTRQISQLQYIQGTTMTADALNYVNNVMFQPENGDRAGVDNILLVITDGESNNQTATVEAARRLRDRGDTSVISLGIGDWVITYELEGMASHPKARNMFHVDEYETLFTATDLLVSTICDVVDDCVSSPCKNGGQCVDSMNQYYCKCQQGFTGRDCDKSCEHRADIVFLLDRSGSIERENFYIMQQFVHDLIHGLDVDGGARVGLVTFSTNARVEFHLGDHNTTQGVLNAMNLRFTGGTTNTAEALRTLRDQMFIPSRGDRPNNINVAILLTDGKSNDRERTLQEAVATRKAGIHLSVIGVGSSIRPAELKGIASDPDDQNVYTVKDFNALTGIIETLLNDVCNENNECSSNPCLNGGTCLDGIASYTCRCTSGYTGLNCERECDDFLDITLVLDSSGSIQKENFGFLIDFAKDLISQFDIESGKVRIALVSFNDTSTVHFYLNSFNNTEDMKFAMDQLRFYGGRTNTAGAIEILRTSVLLNSRGDRSDVSNYAILLTDGLPNINKDQTVLSAIDAKIHGTHIVLVTVGSGLTKGRNYVTLQGIPSEPTASNFFNVPRYRELDRIIPDVANAMCNDINECASNPCQNGGICQDGLRSYQCRCIDTFTGLNCERRCSSQMDIVFVVDISGSIEENNGFDLERSFMKGIIYGLNFEFSRTRIGFVTFAREARTRFYLADYTSAVSQQDILNALVIDSVGFETDISKAIIETRDEVFRGSQGDRPNIDNVMILVSDGKNTVVSDSVTSEEARKVKDLGIQLYTIAIGENPNIGLMENMATQPSSTYYHVLPTRSDVDTVVSDVLETLCL